MAETGKTSAGEERAAQAAKAEKKKPLVPKKVDPHQIVTVRNGFQGKLVYQSPKTGELFVWDEFGAEQDMEIGELRSARSSSKKYFVNNWFMFDEAWVPAYLGVGQYYQYAVRVEDFDAIFEKSPEEVQAIVATMSDGQKQSVAYRARERIADGSIDSNRLIATLEKSLGFALVER